MQLFNISSSLGLLGTCLHGNSLSCCHPMYCQITEVHITPINTVLEKSAGCRGRTKEQRVLFRDLHIRNIFPPKDKYCIHHEPQAAQSSAHPNRSSTKNRECKWRWELPKSFINPKDFALQSKDVQGSWAALAWLNLFVHAYWVLKIRKDLSVHRIIWQYNRLTREVGGATSSRAWMW